MSSENLKEQIEKQLQELDESFNNVDKVIGFPCPQRPHSRCKYAKFTTIPDTDLIGVYCDNKECDVFNLNCNESIIIDIKEN